MVRRVSRLAVTWPRLGKVFAKQFANITYAFHSPESHDSLGLGLARCICTANNNNNNNNLTRRGSRWDCAELDIRPEPTQIINNPHAEVSRWDGAELDTSRAHLGQLIIIIIIIIIIINNPHAETLGGIALCQKSGAHLAPFYAASS
jgi:hypothetical protein